jgi:lipoic acid synthetase
MPTANKKAFTCSSFVHPDEFAEYREIGYALLDYVESGPLVRSSYHSEKACNSRVRKENKWESEKSGVTNL